MNGKSSSSRIFRAVAPPRLSTGLGASAGVFLLTLASALTASAADIVLTEEGNTAYHIATTTEGSELAKHAADELATYLQRVTGGHFAITTANASGPALRLETKASGDLGAEGFRIRSEGRDIRIIGGTPRGLLYGVYTFLEDYAGVRWYGPDYTQVPQQPTLTVPAIERTETPAFAYREAFVREADAPQYSAHNRLNGRFGHRLTRARGDYPEAFVALRMASIFTLVPRKKYAKSHPKYFGGGQLRFAEPEVRQIALETLRKQLKRWSRSAGAPRYVLIEHADRDTFYRGGADGRLIDRHDSAGAAYLDFVKYLAGHIAADYPDVTLLAQAYQWSRKPPRGMKLPENMGIMFSDIERDFARPLQAHGNRTVAADLRGWGELTDEILLWTYITNFGGYLQPYPDLDALTEDVPWLARQPSVVGLFAQGAYNTTGGEFSVLRAWVLAHLLWDPKQDFKRLVQTFLEGYYGAAAPQIAEYIRLLHESVARSGGRLSDKVSPTAEYLTVDLLQQADRLFARAEDAVADDPSRLAHVRKARNAVDYAILTSRPDHGETGWVDHDRRLERLHASLEATGMRAYREGGGASLKRLVQALSIERHAAALPPVCRERPAEACRSAQELSLDLAGGAQIVADASAGDGAAVTMEGHKRAWGIQLPLDRLLPDEGRWQVYVAARATADDSAGTVLRAGIYPGKRRGVSADDLAGEGYRYVELPGLWTHDAGRTVWVAPTGSKAVQAIYVDRIVAVRVNGS